MVASDWWLQGDDDHHPDAAHVSMDRCRFCDHCMLPILRSSPRRLSVFSSDLRAVGGRALKRDDCNNQSQWSCDQKVHPTSALSLKGCVVRGQLLLLVALVTTCMLGIGHQFYSSSCSSFWQGGAY